MGCRASKNDLTEQLSDQYTKQRHSQCQSLVSTSDSKRRKRNRVQDAKSNNRESSEPDNTSDNRNVEHLSDGSSSRETNTVSTVSTTTSNSGTQSGSSESSTSSTSWPYSSSVQSHSSDDFNDSKLPSHVWQNLHDSITNNDLEECENILDKWKIDLNTIHTTHDGYSPDGNSSLSIAPIHLACMFRRTRFVEVFCRHGADVNLRDRNRRTPINICLQYWPRINPSELNIGDSFVALQFRRRIEEIHENSGACLYILLHFGADPSDMVDTSDRTLLHFCARKGLHKAFSILLIAEACIENRDVHGVTPLLHGAKFGPTDMVELILNSRADKNVIDYLGNNLTYYLCENNQISAEFLDLHSSKSTVNIRNKLGETPLMIASHVGNGEKIEILLRKGANSSITDKYGQTCLFHLLHNNDPILCMLGFLSILIATPQICIFDNQGDIPFKLKTNSSKRLRTILEEESSTPVSLYRVSFYKVHSLISANDQIDEITKVIRLNCPGSIATELLTFRNTMSDYWNQRLAGIFI